MTLIGQVRAANNDKRGIFDLHHGVGVVPTEHQFAQPEIAQFSGIVLETTTGSVQIMP